MRKREKIFNTTRKGKQNKEGRVISVESLDISDAVYVTERYAICCVHKLFMYTMSKLCMYNVYTLLINSIRHCLFTVCAHFIHCNVYIYSFSKMCVYNIRTTIVFAQSTQIVHVANYHISDVETMLYSCMRNR